MNHACCGASGRIYLLPTRGASFFFSFSSFLFFFLFFLRNERIVSFCSSVLPPCRSRLRGLAHSHIRFSVVVFAMFLLFVVVYCCRRLPPSSNRMTEKPSTSSSCAARKASSSRRSPRRRPRGGRGASEARAADHGGPGEAARLNGGGRRLAEALGTLPPPEEVDPAQLSPRGTTNKPPTLVCFCRYRPTDA